MAVSGRKARTSVPRDQTGGRGVTAGRSLAVADRPDLWVVSPVVTAWTCDGGRTVQRRYEQPRVPLVRLHIKDLPPQLLPYTRTMPHLGAVVIEPEAAEATSLVWVAAA